VALGAQIPLQLIASKVALLAAVAAALVIAFREMVHRRWLPTGGDHGTYLLFCPNLTMVALAANAMINHGVPPDYAAWVVFTGLFITVASIMALPAPVETSPATAT